MKKILFLLITICSFASCDDVEQVIEEATSSPAQDIPALGQVQTDSNFVVYRYDPAFNSAGVIIVNYLKIFTLISKNFKVLEMDEKNIKDFLNPKTIHKNSLTENQYVCLIQTNSDYKYINLNNYRIGSLEDSILEGPIFIVKQK